MKRGQLRIYLGAAPGVGKTYAMLAEGHRRRDRGTDVVAGFVETYGRKLTAQLAEGLETTPRRVMTYRGASFEELDIDALLTRHPEVALVDELAHTNVPGSRNAKRWQDVEELLAAGINVISTVNIQHLESLNDVVEKITGVPQRERIRTRWCAPRTRSRPWTCHPRRCGGGWRTATSTRGRRSTRRCPTTSRSVTTPRCVSSPCCGSSLALV